jgi:crotonobetainyl-CoA:carnitine CoA-transferase CaiB-like acyl-CoA transferase
MNDNRKNMTTFFSGIKVIELASVLAGPSVGMFFAELGAKVIKIENKAAGGDATRGWRLPGENAAGPSAYFCAVNYGKEHIHLDLRRADDRALLYREVADADIVLGNYLEETSLKLGVDFETLKAHKPDLIFIQLDGFEHSTRLAYDVVLQAETGWISMTGSQSEAPAKLPVALIDILAGHQMKEAALLALLKHARTGQGSMVRCSLEKSSLAALANQASNYLMSNHVAKPMGTQHPNIAPYGDWYFSADGKKLVLAVGTDAQFEKLCDVLDVAVLAKQANFSSNVRRVANRNLLNAALGEAIASFTLADLEADFAQAGIPFGVVRQLDEVLTTATAKSMLLESEMEGHPTRRLSSIAFNAAFLDA